jgi:hypothetical protein
MKSILITVILQLVTPPAEPGKPAPEQQLEVKSHAMQEFDSKEACINAAKGLTAMGAVGGGVFSVFWGCAPKDLGKLEVDKPKTSPQQLRRAQPEPQRGSAA